MKKLSIAALALTLIAVGVVTFAPHAGAQAPSGFMTIDAVSVTTYSSGLGITVTGVKAGETTSFSMPLSFVSSEPTAVPRFEACHRMLLLALSKPGQYVLRLNGACTVALAAP